jgi:hypothetical protein
MGAIFSVSPGVVLKDATAENAFRLNRRLLVSGVSARAPPGTSASLRAKALALSPSDLRNRRSAIPTMMQIAYGTRFTHRFETASLANGFYRVPGKLKTLSNLCIALSSDP